MFAKSRKEKFVEQAQDLAHDLSEAIAPHVEKARDEIAPRLADARDTVAPRLSDARDAVAPRLHDARDAVAPRLAVAAGVVAPKLAEARDAVSPHLENARDTVAPHVGSARDRIVDAVAPTLGSVRDSAREQADEARRRGGLAAAALKGEPVKKTGGKRKWLLVAVLAGAGAFVAKKLTSGSDADNWQSTYTPTPAPGTSSTTSSTPVAAPVTPAAPTSGSDVGDQQVDLGRVGVDDSAGASPGEVISDSTEVPHPVTTPDSPAETVDVTEVKDPDKS